MISWVIEAFGQSRDDNSLSFVISRRGYPIVSGTKWAVIDDGIDEYFENSSKSLSVWLRNLH